MATRQALTHTRSVLRARPRSSLEDWGTCVWGFTRLGNPAQPSRNAGRAGTGARKRNALGYGGGMAAV